MKRGHSDKTCAASMFDHLCLRRLAKVGWSDRVSNLQVRKCVPGENGSDTFQDNKIMQARSCVAYGTLSPTKLGPVFNSTNRVGDVSKRPTDHMAALDEECYGWFEQSGIFALTCLRLKR